MVLQAGAAEPRQIRLRIGFVGLGTMGGPIAGHILAAGHGLTVTDIRRDAADGLMERGAAWAPTPAAVAASSDMVFTALPGPAEVEAVYGGPAGLLVGAEAGTYLVDLSTSTPDVLRQLAVAAETAGIQLLDAPLSGGVRGARKGNLTVMVGGAAAAFAACEPVLRAFGEHVFHMGPLGTGYVAKLVNNYMGISNALASMEAMVFGAKAGVDPERLLEVVNLGTGASHMTRTLYPFLVFPGRFEPVRFSLDLAVKDVALGLSLAAAGGVPTIVGPAVHEALARAVEAGLGDKDMSTYVTLLERAAGVELRAPQ